jgi:hypothetical protein
LSGGQLLFRRRDNVLILTFVAILRRGEKLAPVVRFQKVKKIKNVQKLEWRTAKKEKLPLCFFHKLWF